jgi:hypothetical protein
VSSEESARQSEIAGAFEGVLRVLDQLDLDRIQEAADDQERRVSSMSCSTS